VNEPLKRGKVMADFAGLALPKFQKARKAAPKATKPEAVLQRQVEAYCALVGLECFHIPEWVLNMAFGWNPNRTGPQINAMRNASQDIKGFPDCMIFDPKRQGLVLAGELKTEIGKVSAAQEKWRKVLGTRIWRSFEEAKADIDGWRAS
jgi:hypothetical protein